MHSCTLYFDFSFFFFLSSETRAAASLLATAQLNQRRPPSPQPPPLPGQMMSSDRAVRVRPDLLCNLMNYDEVL